MGLRSSQRQGLDAKQRRRPLSAGDGRAQPIGTPSDEVRAPSLLDDVVARGKNNQSWDAALVRGTATPQRPGVKGKRLARHP